MAVLVAAAVVAGCAAPEPVNPVGSSAAGRKAGLSMGGKVFPWEDDAPQSFDVAAAASTGAAWIRIDVQWNVVQAKGPTSWNWHAFDTMVRKSEQAGLKVMAVLSWTPDWANGGRGMYAAPSDPSAFAKFAAAAAERYGPGGPGGTHVRWWEIWNEPNNPIYWTGAPNAPAYVALLEPTFSAIKARDPGATVITGGLAPNGDLNADPTNPMHPINYLKAMYAAGAHGSFDAVGHHPYAPNKGPLVDTPGADGWNSFLYTETIHQVMQAHGDGAKKIWGTETGLPTGTCERCFSETTQRDWLVQEYFQWAAWSFTGPLFWHSARDEKTGSAQRSENFGLLRTDFSSKPAFSTAKDLWTD
jgi:hypothetical protein